MEHLYLLLYFIVPYLALSAILAALAPYIPTWILPKYYFTRRRQ